MQPDHRLDQSTPGAGAILLAFGETTYKHYHAMGLGTAKSLALPKGCDEMDGADSPDVPSELFRWPSQDESRFL